MKNPSFIVAFIALSVSSSLQAANYCGELKNAYGPFDYTDSANRSGNNASQSPLELVESAHFTPSVEHLIKGNTASLGGDLAYTLRVFPNHHRALMSIGKLALRDKKLRADGASYSVECFFDRAIRFKPDDGVVRMVYGIYLSQSGNLEKAIEQMEEAVRLQPENANVNYNLGLLYMKKKNYEQANIYAKKAYKLGFPLPGLKNKLIDAGKWSEAPE